MTVEAGSNTSTSVEGCLFKTGRSGFPLEMLQESVSGLFSSNIQVTCHKSYYNKLNWAPDAVFKEYDKKVLESVVGNLHRNLLALVK